MGETKLRIADFGGEVDELENSAGYPLFKEVTVNWGRPRTLARAGSIVIDGEHTAPGYLYAIFRNHHRAREYDKILYIGITNNLKRRFANHPKVHELKKMAGETCMSIGEIDFGSYRTAAGSGNRRAIEELEHIFIWTLWFDLWNDKKQATMPGMGKHPGRAWHIHNEGYGFHGRMPSEIIFPWILTRPRRNRTMKRPAQL